MRREIEQSEKNANASENAQLLRAHISERGLSPASPQAFFDSHRPT